MGLLSSKEAKEAKEPCNKPQNDHPLEGGNWNTKKRNHCGGDYEFDVASRLRALASNSYKKTQLFDEYEEEEQIGGDYSELDGYTNPMDVPFPTDNNDIDLRLPKQHKYLKYQKDILTMLKGGNVEDSEINNEDHILKGLENVYDNEGCGCSSPTPIVEGCGCADNMLGGNWEPKNSKKEKYIDEQNEKFANMIFSGGKRKKIANIELTTSANNSTSAYAIASSSSIGYKTSESNSKSLNIMPFYSTPESSTSPLVHNNNSVHINSTTSGALSNTSTVLSNTSSAGNSVINSNISTTSDNYIKRPKGSAKRY